MVSQKAFRFSNSTYAQPNINDPNLTAEAIIEGLSFPTSMAFLDDNNILILEKEGSISLVSNGILQDTLAFFGNRLLAVINLK